MAKRKKKKIVRIPKTVAEARDLFVLETGLHVKLKRLNKPGENYIMTVYTTTGIPLGETGFLKTELASRKYWILWSRKSGIFLGLNIEVLLKDITTKLKRTNPRIM